MTISPIETRYAGCRFRSRLEARWAVFFDDLGIKWEYEPQGFQVGDGGRPYLPDFWLPATGTWVEVKGSDHALDLPLLVEALDSVNILPDVQGVGEHRGILILGPIPDVRIGEVAIHWLIHAHKGVWRGARTFTTSGSLVRPGPTFLSCHVDGDNDEVGQGSCWVGSSEPEVVPSGISYVAAQVMLGGGAEFIPVARAYAAARSARFEHGERG